MVSSRDHTESNKEKSHFRNSKFSTPRTTGAYPAISPRHEGHHTYSRDMWHEKKHSYGSASSRNHPSDVSYSQEQKGTRNPFGAQHGDRIIYSNGQKSIAGQLSMEQYRYYKRCSYGPGPSETLPSDVSYSQEQKGRRTPYGAFHEDTSIDSNHQKSIAGQLSEEKYRYHGRRGTSFSCAHNENFSHYNNRQKYISDRMPEDRYKHYKQRETQMGTYLSEEDVCKNNNHPKSINGWTSGEKYRYYTRGGKQVGTSFSGAASGDFNNYNNHQRSVTDRMSEGSYRYYRQHERQRDTYLSGAYPRDTGNYNNDQKLTTYQSSGERYGFYRLPGKQKEWVRSSGNHAPPASLHLPEFNPDVMTAGKDICPLNTLNSEHCKGAVTVPACSNDVTSIAVSVKNVTIENDATLHGISSKENASGHGIQDEKNKDGIDSSDKNYSSPEGTKNNLNISKHVNVGNASEQSTIDKSRYRNSSSPEGKEKSLSLNESGENGIESRDTFRSSPEGTEKNLNLNESKHVNVGNNESAIHEESIGDAVDGLLQLGQIESIAPRKSIFRTSKKLLVLDLNGILVDIVRVPNAAQIHADREHINIYKKTAFKRPFCEEFLNFCFTVFDIGIWSSRMKHNVEVVVDYLMGNMKKKLLFCWDNEKCTYTGCNTLENAYKPLVLKELSKLWDKDEPGLPWEKGAYSASNTLLIDDSPYKALCNPPCTGIFPQPYNFKDAKDTSLGPGGELRVFLEGLVKADDVKEYVEKNPIGQPSIKANSKSWNFYLQIIERVGKSKKRDV